MATKPSDGVQRNGYQAYPSPPRTPKCTIYESGGSSQLLCVEIKSTPQTRPTSRPVYSNCNERDYSKFVSPSKRRVFEEIPDEPLFNTQFPIRKEPVGRKGLSKIERLPNEVILQIAGQLRLSELVTLSVASPMIRTIISAPAVGMLNTEAVMYWIFGYERPGTPLNRSCRNVAGPLLSRGELRSMLDHLSLNEQISDDVYEAWIYGLDQQDAQVRELEAGSRMVAV
ncbi:MAG: hypothetical protein OHK93_004209 [Ramalina farinacea]|uniref:F-box domain-containing protein n=1 Tax=Ramalina farinacea TaxID=258253 RepID=A0AA43QKK4_9LECA|nr:hypothetical protein [Ramalina farinacea]